MDKQKLLEMYERMCLIRAFEEACIQLYMEKEIRGSLHPCVGQEATAVGSCFALNRDDYLTCTYRGHGACIAKGVDVNAAMAEMLSRRTGISKGKGFQGVVKRHGFSGVGGSHCAARGIAQNRQKLTAKAAHIECFVVPPKEAAHFIFRHDGRGFSPGRAVTSHLLPTYARANLAFERGEGAWLTATDGSRMKPLRRRAAISAASPCGVRPRAGTAPIRGMVMAPLALIE